jgi:hypothetical protein
MRPWRRTWDVGYVQTAGFPAIFPRFAKRLKRYRGTQHTQCQFSMHQSRTGVSRQMVRNIYWFVGSSYHFLIDASRFARAAARIYQRVNSRAQRRCGPRLNIHKCETATGFHPLDRTLPRSYVIRAALKTKGGFRRITSAETRTIQKIIMYYVHYVQL